MKTSEITTEEFKKSGLSLRAFAVTLGYNHNGHGVVSKAMQGKYDDKPDHAFRRRLDEYLHSPGEFNKVKIMKELTALKKRVNEADKIIDLLTHLLR